MADFKISVIIPTYNTGNLLKDCFDSIKSQTIGFDSIEVIFVDDASSDNYTLDLIKSYVSDFDNCNAIFLDENSGFPGKPRNIGLKHASADFVIFSDHDDSYALNAFEVMFNTIISENSDMVIMNYYKVYDNKKIIDENDIEEDFIKINNIEEDLRFFEISPSIWAKLFRKDFLIKNKILFLEEMLAEDLYFYCNALFNSNSTVYLNSFYGYNYKIRNTKYDKSTIHIRNKKYLDEMVSGYFKTWDLLKKYNKEEYFSFIFRKHLLYWLNGLMFSDISNNEKIELLNKINPLFKKQLDFDNGFNEKIFESLNKPIIDNDYNKIINILNGIRLKREIIDKIKKFFKR